MSDDLSPRLSLPYLHPSQAQKHVTHNEALRLLDLLVQPVVLSRSTTSPPSDPLLGMCYVVASGAEGAFAGQAGKIAAYEVSGWAFLTPVAGWRVLVLDEAVEIRFDGTTWVGPEASTLRLAGLGIGTPFCGRGRDALGSR